MDDTIIYVTVIATLIIMILIWASPCIESYPNVNEDLKTCVNKSDGAICIDENHPRDWAWCNNQVCLPELIRNGP